MNGFQERVKRKKEEEKELQQQIIFERAQKHAVIDEWRSKIQQEYLDQQQVNILFD